MRVIWQCVGVTAVVLLVGFAALAHDETPGKMNPVIDPVPAVPVKQVVDPKEPPAPMPPMEPVPARPVEPPPPPKEPVPPRPATPSTSTNVIRSAGNGWGNTIIVDNGGSSRGTTVIENSRNGVGNRVVVVDGKVVTDVGAAGKEVRFGDVKFYSPLHGCTVYWDPKSLAWYRYDSVRERYVPAPLDGGRDD